MSAFSTYRRNCVWADEFLLWKDTVGKSAYKSRGYTYLGIAYAKIRQFDTAHFYIQKALTLDPNDIEAVVNMGALYKDRGQLEPAAAQFSRGIALRPDLPESYAGLAEVRLKQGDYRRATELLEKVSRMKPYDPDVHFQLGMAYAQAGNLMLAEKTLKNVLKNADDDYAILNSLGNVYLMSNRYEKAIFYYRQAVKSNQAELEPLYNTALAYERLDQKKDALVCYEKFVSLAAGSKRYNEASYLARQRILFLKRKQPVSAR